jgi:hypothetical protein
LPEDYSASYKRVVQRNFDEGGADYTIPTATKGHIRSSDSLMDLLRRVDMTKDSMDEDEDRVIPYNFTEVGCLLLEFVFALSKVAGFETSDESLISSARVGLIAEFLRGLDRLDTDDLARAAKIADFMKDYFGAEFSSKATFFVVEPCSLSLRNPLLGNYPVYANGKSAQTPLPAVWHMKYSKSGKESGRLIKPGKYTRISSTGQMGSPWPLNTGNKLVRQASGRFRHIASYSLEELIELGWDGAMYICSATRAKPHEASGMQVAFIPGYDSDEEDTYDPIDVVVARRAGILGLPADEVGAFISIPGYEVTQILQGPQFDERFGGSQRGRR